MRTKRIIFTGGGSGGHIIPIIAVFRELNILSQKEGTNLKVYYLGPRDRFNSLISGEGIKKYIILSGKIRRYFSLGSFIENTIDIIKIPIGVIEAFFLLFFLFPDIIFSKGGYGSVPTVIAAKMLGIPVVLHESDVSPGLANRFISKWADKIFVSFPPSQEEYFSPKRMIYVGNPIREGLFKGQIKEARIMFNLVGDKPVVLILGGSQGSRRINDKVLDGLPQLLRNFEIIHQCGSDNFSEVRKEAEVIMPDDLVQYYHLLPFLNEAELANAYAVSSFIVSRAGSGSTFEIAALGKPSILIPLPEAAQDHQVKNAYAYAKTGAAYVVEESNFTVNFIIGQIRDVLSHPKEYQRMSQAALNFSRPKAAYNIAKQLLDFLRE